MGVSSDLLEEGAAGGGLWGSSDPLSESPERALDKSFQLQVRGRWLWCTTAAAAAGQGGSKVAEAEVHREPLGRDCMMLWCTGLCTHR